MTMKSNSDIDAAQRKNGYLPYARDAYGCHDVLLAKRRARNPFARFHPYYTSAPELGALFNWCPGADDEGGPGTGTGNGNGQTAVFRGPLPWDKLR